MAVKARKLTGPALYGIREGPLGEFLLRSPPVSSSKLSKNREIFDQKKKTFFCSGKRFDPANSPPAMRVAGISSSFGASLQGEFGEFIPESEREEGAGTGICIYNFIFI